MFDMSDLSIELYLTKKSNIFPLKDTSLDVAGSKFSDMLPRQAELET